VVIPEAAILPLPTGTVVWVVTGDKPERRPVELGVRRPGFVEIRSGVAVGDQVVVGGAERLTPQSTVKAVVKGT
jgi:membrane fusion protein, multidrug efflux system